MYLIQEYVSTTLEFPRYVLQLSLFIFNIVMCKFDLLILYAFYCLSEDGSVSLKHVGNVMYMDCWCMWLVVVTLSHSIHFYLISHHQTNPIKYRNRELCKYKIPCQFTGNQILILHNIYIVDFCSWFSPIILFSMLRRVYPLKRSKTFVYNLNFILLYSLCDDKGCCVIVNI